MLKMKNRINRKIDRIWRQIQTDRASVGGGNRSPTFDNDKIDEVEEINKELQTDIIDKIQEEV